MSAEQIGERAWTHVEIRHVTAERLRRVAPGEGYDSAIARLFQQAARATPRIVTHFGRWRWMAACGGCGWYRIVRGRRASIDRILDEHVAACPVE